MSLCKFDTFENETEMNQLIKNLQDRSIEFLKLQDPWDKVSTNPIKSQDI